MPASAASCLTATADKETVTKPCRVPSARPPGRPESCRPEGWTSCWSHHLDDGEPMPPTPDGLLRRSPATPMSSTRRAPLSRPARMSAKPTPSRLAALAPTSGALAEPRVLVLARGQLLGVRAVARTMISHTVIRKASAAASQPATTANPHVTNRRSTSATTSPIYATPAARRMAGAVPAHPAVVQDWWRDGGHRRSVADPNSACHRPPSRSLLAQLALRTALQAGRLGRDPGRGHGSTSLVVSAGWCPRVRLRPRGRRGGPT